jgi:hypothetical protein
MKRLALNLGTGLLLAVAFLQAGFKSGQQQNNTPLSYMGEIMDSTCAGRGSHDQMMAKEGTKTAKDCTLLCTKDGSKFVLYSRDAKTSYNLDDQDKVRDYAGEKVTIVGTYDGPSKTIHIQSITVAPQFDSTAAAIIPRPHRASTASNIVCRLAWHLAAYYAIDAWQDILQQRPETRLSSRPSFTIVQARKE